MKRYLVAWMCSLSAFLFYCMRLNVNFCILEMVGKHNKTEIQKFNENMSQTNLNGNNSQERASIPTFDWDMETQQMILGAFYYGYTIMPIPGGWLAGKIGGKRIIIFSLIFTSLLTALIPWAAGVSSDLLIILRVLDGLVQGLFLPATYVLLEQWTVEHERSTIVSIYLSGMSIAVIVVNPVSEWLCSLHGGWPVSFYTYSTLGGVLAILLIVLLYERPNEDPCIQNKEIEYVKRYLNENDNIDKNKSVPWLDIFTSPPVLALIIVYSAFGLVLSFILTEGPTFVYTILKYDVTKTGRITSIPGILECLTTLFSGLCADYIIRREYFTVLNTRKLFSILMFGISAVCLICIRFVEHNPAANVVLLSLAFGALGFNAAGVYPNAMEIAKNYSGVIVGMMSTLASCTGFIGPMIIGILINENNTHERWSLVFTIFAGIEIFATVVFLIFGKADQQKWSMHETLNNEEYEHLIMSKQSN